MNLKERLNRVTSTAIDADNKRQSQEALMQREKEKQKVVAARAQADEILLGIEDKAFKAAENKKRRLDVLKTDFSYSAASNADIRVNKDNIDNLYYKQHLFDNKMREYFIVEHIVKVLEMDVILEFQHDGVGVNSWYVIVMVW